MPRSPQLPTGPGALVLVVGPSGGGKDALIDGARQALAGNPRFIFPRREITRSAEAGGEDHLPVSDAAFAAREAAGAYALAWRAHGLAYGIPASIADDLAQGRTVCINVSRTMVEAARQRFGPVRIVAVTADLQVLAARLAGRDRERPEEIAARLARADAISVTGPDVIEIANNGPLADGIAALVDALRTCHPQTEK